MALGELIIETTKEFLSTPVGAFIIPVGSLINPVVVALSNQSLSLGNLLSSATSSLFSPITDIWFWLLYNVLTPFIMISFLYLFFRGQFYLFELYKFIVKNGYDFIVNTYVKISGSKEIKKYLKLVDLGIR